VGRYCDKSKHSHQQLKSDWLIVPVAKFQRYLTIMVQLLGLLKRVHRPGLPARSCSCLGDHIEGPVSVYHQIISNSESILCNNNNNHDCSHNVVKIFIIEFVNDLKKATKQNK